MLKKGLGKGILAIVLSISLILSLGGFGFAYNEHGEEVQRNVRTSASDFHQGDVAVINNLIDNHNLNWERYAVDSWPAEHIGWEATAGGVYRITGLSFHNWDLEGLPIDLTLTGDLDLSALIYLESLALINQEITRLNVSGLTRLRSLSTQGSENITHIDVSGVDEFIWFVHGSETLEEFIFPNGNRFSLIRSSSAPERVYINAGDNHIFLYFEEIGTQFFDFEYWDVTGVTLEDPTNPITQISMRYGGDVTIRAVYSIGTTSFYQGDIEVINNMIRALDLRWIEDDISSWAFVRENGGVGVRWSSSNPRRVVEVWYSTGGNSWGYDPTRSVDISGLTELRTFIVNNQNISNLEIGTLNNLRTLHACGSFSQIDLSGVRGLDSLALFGHLTDIDLSGMVDLTHLWLWGNELTSIDLSGLYNVVHLILSDNNLTDVDISDLVNLQVFEMYEQNMRNIDLRGTFHNSGQIRSPFLRSAILPNGGELEIEIIRETSIEESNHPLRVDEVAPEIYVQIDIEAGGGSGFVFLVFCNRGNEQIEFSHWETTGIETILYESSTSHSAILWVAMSNSYMTINAIYNVRDLDVRLGDINGDGTVNILDLQLLLRHVSRRNILTDERQLLAADVNRDGNVDILDLRLLLQYVSRRIDSFD